MKKGVRTHRLRKAKKPKSGRGDVVEGVERAAARIGRPPEWVSVAKRLGAPGCMLGSRFDIPVLKKWVDANVESILAELSKVSSGDQIKAHEARIAKVKADEAEGRVLEKEWAIGRLRSLLESQKRILYGKLGDELPIQWTLDVPTNRALGLVVADMILGEIAAEVTIWEGK